MYTILDQLLLIATFVKMNNCTNNRFYLKTLLKDMSQSVGGAYQAGMCYKFIFKEFRLYQSTVR